MFSLLSRLIERTQNKIVLRPPYSVPLEAFTLHQELFVVDMHADALLWKRNLNRRGREGHVDVPRLLAGNVGLQVFGVVTRMPPGANFYKSRARGDLLTPLLVAQGWPLRTWRSLFRRALHQAGKLEKFAAESQGRLVRVLSKADLDNLLARRARREAVVGGFTALEGVHALQKRVERLDVLAQAGFRMIGLTHFFDNDAGGSAHGMAKGGLTPFGREVVRRTQALNMVVDLAHASEPVFNAALEMTTAPVVVSHTGVRGTHDSPRNLSDAQIRRIAAVDGVVGITLFQGALAEASMAHAARAMAYTAALVGVEHVGLGSDFDGGVLAPVDASGLALLTEALLAEGFQGEEIRKIMGANALRVLRAVLPET